jgi:hypothetical protein
MNLNSTCRTVRQILLATLLIPIGTWAAPRFGAELEVPEKHLTPWVQYIDFSQLKVTFFEKIDQGKVPLKSTIAEGLALNPPFAPTTARFNSAFTDMPLSIPNFLDVIPESLRQVLTDGMTLPVDVVITRGAELPKAGRLVLSNSSLQNTSSASLGLFGADGKPLQSQSNLAPQGLEQRDEKMQTLGRLVDYQTFWQKVTRRWNKMPLLERMEAIDWSHLGATQKAKLLSGHYELLSKKDNGPEQGDAFIQDPLALRWTDTRAAELFSKFYVTPDGMAFLLRGGVAEFHTLHPDRINPFLAEFKSLLRFHQVERRVLQPKPDELQEFGLHVHVSAPVLREMNDVEVSQFKVLLALRGLEKGDLSVLMNTSEIKTAHGNLSAQDYSLEIPMDRKDLLRRVNEDRFEIRYFVDDVESELREYNRLLSFPKEELLKSLDTKISELRSKKLFLLTAKLKPQVLHFLFPFEMWDQLQLTTEERDQAIKALRHLDISHTYTVKGAVKYSPMLAHVLVRQISARVQERASGMDSQIFISWLAEFEQYHRMVAMGFLPQESPNGFIRRFQTAVLKSLIVNSILERNSFVASFLLRGKNEIYANALLEASRDPQLEQRIDPIYMSRISNIPGVLLDSKVRDAFLAGLRKASQPRICIHAQKR